MLKTDGTILVGQGIWALGQIVILASFTKVGGVDQTAAYVLALSIFAPLSLLLGLNLRSIIAIDSDQEIDVNDALGYRVAASTICLLASMGLVFALQEQTCYEVGVLTLIMAMRIVDASSEITFGLYQKEHRHHRIGVSLVSRGILTILPMAFCYFALLPLHLGALIAFVGNWISFIYIDVLCAGLAFRIVGIDAGRLIRAIRGKAWALTQPFFDSLFLNSFRYLTMAFAGPAALALLGIAQSLYAPIQLVVTTLGYRFLSSAKSAAVSLDPARIAMVKRHAVLLSACSAGSFVLLSAAIPESVWRLLFGETAQGVHRVALIFAIAVSLLPFAGFYGQFLLASGSAKRLLVSTTAGLAAMGFVAVGYRFTIGSSASLEHISGMFLAASIIRVMLFFPAGNSAQDRP